MDRKTSALTTLRRINAEEITLIGAELSQLRVEDELYTLEYSVLPDELWEVACALRILVKSNCLALDAKALRKLGDVFRHVIEHYESKKAKAIVSYLNSDL